MREGKKALLPKRYSALAGLCLIAVLLLLAPATSQAYTYQSDEYRFNISSPEKPVRVTVMGKKDEYGVALDFSRENSDYPVWAVMLEPAQDADDNFIDPTTLTPAELQNYFDALKSEDYDGAIFEKADIVRAGKYNATLLIIRDGQEMNAMAMFKADRENYVITLLTDRGHFEQDLSVFKQYLTTFVEL